MNVLTLNLRFLLTYLSPNAKGEQPANLTTYQPTCQPANLPIYPILNRQGRTTF